MKAFQWLNTEHVLAIHADLIRETGGVDGIRDRSLLESALSRPQNLFFYEQNNDVFEIAAEYVFGIIRNHSFVDGNKRAAFGAGTVFLGLNNYDVNKEVKDEQEKLIYKFAKKDISRKEFATFLKDNSNPQVQAIEAGLQLEEKTKKPRSR